MFEARPERRIIQNQNVFNKPESGWFANPKMKKAERALRPKIGKNPFLTMDPVFQREFGSAGNKRAAFKPAFASPTGFNLYKKSHPNTKLTQTWKDIDGDQIKDAVVTDGDGHIISVNGMVIRDSKWSQLRPYYESSAAKRLAWEKEQGFRDADDVSKVSGISKVWKDRFLKHVYDMVLSKDVPQISEDEAKTITEIRKAFPVGAIAKAFISNLMRQEAIKALQNGGFTGSDEEAEAAIKSLIKTKKFKAYVFQLAMSAEQNDNYFRYLANLIRDYIYNATEGSADIAQAKSWQNKGLEVTDVGEDAFTVKVPGAAVATGVGSPAYNGKLMELISQLEQVASQTPEEVDAQMIGIARSLKMPHLDSSTNVGTIYDWAVGMASTLGLA